MSESDEAFQVLARLEFDENSFNATLQYIVDLACMNIESCSMAGMTLLERGGPTTTVASSVVAARVDAVQYETNSGPCLDAYRRQTINRIDATETDNRWVEFSRNAFNQGILSTLSLPLIVNGDGLGAINLYADRVNAFGETAERMGAIFASHASMTLANARAYWKTEDLRRNLEEALESRGVIEQAKGILMAREGCSAEDAFDILRRASQRANRKVNDLAAEIVASAGRGSGES